MLSSTVQKKYTASLYQRTCRLYVVPGCLCTRPNHRPGRTTSCSLYIRLNSYVALQITFIEEAVFSSHAGIRTDAFTPRWKTNATRTHVRPGAHRPPDAISGTRRELDTLRHTHNCTSLDAGTSIPRKTPCDGSARRVLHPLQTSGCSGEHKPDAQVRRVPRFAPTFPCMPPGRTRDRRALRVKSTGQCWRIVGVLGRLTSTRSSKVIV